MVKKLLIWGSRGVRGVRGVRGGRVQKQAGGKVQEGAKVGGRERAPHPDTRTGHEHQHRASVQGGGRARVRVDGRAGKSASGHRLLTPISSRTRLMHSGRSAEQGGGET